MERQKMKAICQLCGKELAPISRVVPDPYDENREVVQWFVKCDCGNTLKVMALSKARAIRKWDEMGNRYAHLLSVKS